MEFLDILRFVAALVFVLGLIGGLAWIVRHFKLAERFANLAPSTRRLKVIESLPIDARRRLVIVRRDDVEHLIVLGQNSETVVETNIAAPAETAFIPAAIENMPDHDSDTAQVPRLHGDAA